MLNGLGTVKYEELFVVYRQVDQLLRAAGIDIVEPDVGELVTSFDMAGVSLTLFWLTSELEATCIALAAVAAVGGQCTAAMFNQTLYRYFVV